jgi:hypothetical protein
MRPEDRISAAAADFGLALLVSPALSPDEDNVYHIILDRSSPNSKIRKLQANLELEGIGLQVGYYGESADVFRSALTESISKVFGSQIEGVTVFRSGGAYQVVIFADSDSGTLAAEAEEHVNQIRRLFDNPPVALRVELDVNKPTAVEFLFMARRKAPVICETMLEELSSRGFQGLTLEWINHQFDRLRKGGLLHRQGNRTYVLTQAGLQALGSGKGRNSPDVTRLLDLARRRL